MNNMANQVASGFRGANSGSAGRNRAAGKLQGDIIPKGHKLAQLQNFDPQQMQLYNQAFGHLGEGSYLSRLAGGDEELLRQSEAPAWRDLQQAQGQLATRFSGFGMGGTRGSGFKNAANQQSMDFAQQLQANRQSLQRQAINDLMGLSNQLLGQRPQDRFLVEKQYKPSFGEQFLGAAGSFLGGVGQGFGGSLGKSAGNKWFGE